MKKKLYIWMSLCIAPCIAIPPNAEYMDEEGNYYDSAGEPVLIKIQPQRPTVPPKPQPNSYKPTYPPAPYKPKKEKPLKYNESFYASQGPKQGKMSIGGMMTQVTANVLGKIGANNKNRDLMNAAYGLQGMGEILSRTNDTRDPWGRFPGNPDYNKKPRNNVPYQKPKHPSGQNQNGWSARLKPVPTPFTPAVQPAEQIPGKIQQKLPQTPPVNTGQIIQESVQNKGETKKKAETTV